MALEPKFIGKDEVGKLLNPRILLDRLEDALGKMTLGKDGGVEQPMRSAVSVEKHRGFLLVMPGYSSSDDALATKLISFYPENVERPSHQAWIMLFEPTNGDLCAIIDGVNITSIRTGIVSAVATKHLAHPNSRILAIIGTGVQAYGHFEALCLVQHFDEVRVWGRTYERAQKLVQVLSARPDVAATTIKVCATAQEAVTDADVICTVTFATTPVIYHDWVKPGAHINAIGACRPDWQELDSALMRSAVVYTDSREACVKESGDIVLSECEVYADIGEVITGQKEAQWQQTTIFKSVGLAIEDVISAKLVYDECLKQNAAASQMPSFLSAYDKL